VDVGQVDGAWFVNNAAVAMEPEVTLESRRLRWLRGSLRYLVALLRTLRRLRAWNLRVTWEEGDFSGPAYLLSVCNGPRSGGLFPMAPGARVDDGWLDFVLVPQIGNLAVTEVLWRLLRGRHREHPAVLSGRSRWLRVTSEPATALHADGEMRPGLRGEVRFEIGGRKLRVLGRNFCG
jgi:diacylglycerol kinase (ATP)